MTDRARLRAEIERLEHEATEQKVFGDAWERRGYMHEACKRWMNGVEAKHRAAALTRELEALEKKEKTGGDA